MTTTELERISVPALELVRPLPFYEATTIDGARCGRIFQATSDKAATVIAMHRYGAAVFSVERYSVERG